MSYDGDAISDQEWSSAEDQNWEQSLEEIPCPDCNGEGRVDEIDYSKVNSATIDIPYKSVRCEKCKGTGKIEVEDEEE